MVQGPDHRLSRNERATRLHKSQRPHGFPEMQAGRYITPDAVLHHFSHRIEFIMVGQDHHRDLRRVSGQLIDVVKNLGAFRVIYAGAEDDQVRTLEDPRIACHPVSSLARGDPQVGPIRLEPADQTLSGEGPSIDQHDRHVLVGTAGIKVPPRDGTFAFDPITVVVQVGRRSVMSPLRG